MEVGRPVEQDVGRFDVLVDKTALLKLARSRRNSDGEAQEASAIVVKLLAKMAEDRYQTATGLENDLRRCETEWMAQRWVDDFPLGERDTPNRLLIPEKLYGRQREVGTLLAARRVSRE
jgi:hypothetical protein